MKWLLYFILSHSIFIAFCSVALSLQTLQLLAVPVNAYLLAFIFFATLAGYNAYWTLSRYSFGGKATISVFFQKSTSALVVIFCALAGMLYCLNKVHLVMYNILLTAILLGLYAVPVLPFRRLHFARKAGFIKTVLLAFAWTIVTILVPIQTSILHLGPAAVLIFIGRFLFMLMLCIIFDKRDAAIDKIRGLQSLATDLRPRMLHYLMGIVFVIYTISCYLVQQYEVTGMQATALLLAGLIAVIVYVYSFQRRGYLFYYFLVDGLMFLSGLLTGLASI